MGFAFAGGIPVEVPQQIHRRILWELFQERLPLGGEGFLFI